MAEKDNKKKQIPLRLSAQLYNAIAAWAEDDFMYSDMFCSAIIVAGGSGKRMGNMYPNT